MYSKLDFGKNRLTLTSPSLHELAKKVIIEAIAEEQGRNVNNFELYLNGWVESLNECSNGEITYTIADVPCQASDNLVYSNAHYYNGRTPLNSAETTELCREVESLLEKLVAIFN